MGQNPAKQFSPAKPIGAINQPNQNLMQSQAPMNLPQNVFQPLIQNQIPTIQTANAVPGAPTNYQPLAFGKTDYSQFGDFYGPQVY